MAIRLKNIWWLLLLKGILLLIFGFVAIGWPAMTFLTLAFVFALFILFSGISNIIGGIMGMMYAHKYWFLTIIIGIFEIGVGAYALNNPGISITALTLLIGFTFVIRGIFETVSAFDDIYSSSHKVLLMIGGLLGIIAGIIVLKYPVTGSLAFTWVLGLYAVVSGSIFVALSIMTRGAIEEITRSGDRSDFQI